MPHRRVRELLHDKVFVTVPGNAPVREVARLMRTRQTSAVLVVERGRLTGICTERDIVLGVVAEGRDPERVSVDKIMTVEPRTITGDKPFGHALHLMYEGGFRHLPVVDEHHRPIGLLSARDALEVDAAEFSQELVRREEISVIL